LRGEQPVLTLRFMPKLKLTYFDFHGGRGEVARIALTMGGVAFEDDRLPVADWLALKPSTPFGALPVLEVDGQIVSQSNTINRYTGKLANLYPHDPFQAALCDEVMDALEDVVGQVVATFSITDEAAKKAKREELVDGPISFYLKRVEALLDAHGGEWFADGRLTVADLKVFLWIRNLRSGKLDYIPTDLPDRVAPKLVEHFERVNGHPGVRAYYDPHGL